MTRSELDDVLSRASGGSQILVTDEQWECISAPLSPTVIVAGAGTGKTFVMAARVLWLVGSGFVDAHEILGLTFTNKAAAELAARVAGLLSVWNELNEGSALTESGEPTIGTYHSFARRLIDEQGLRVGIEPGARLLSPASVAQLAYRIVCTADGLEACARYQPSRLAADLIALDANLAEQTISVAELRTHDRSIVDTISGLAVQPKPVLNLQEAARRRLELAALVDALRAERIRVGGLDFSDHMRLCVDLVARSPEIRKAMRETFRVILLDEYQDTSIAQRTILSSLFEGMAVTAVGDPLQAIYGWRSASVANIAAFGKHFGAPERAVPMRLTVNRRSGDRILAAANEIAADLRLAHPEVAELRTPAARASTIRATLLPTVADERKWLAEAVAAMVHEGRPPGEIAILGRANAELEHLQAALLARRIPASISGAATLGAGRYAREVLATLRLLDDPGNNTAAVVLLTGPRWRIGPADLAALAVRADELAGHPGRRHPETSGELRVRLIGSTEVLDSVLRPALLEAASDPGSSVSEAAAARLGRFAREIRSLNRSVAVPLPDLVAAVISMLGVETERASSSADSDEPGLEGLLQLVDGFGDADGRAGLGAFLAYLDAADQLGAAEKVDLPIRADSVQLMTVHKAKGLEFPVVFLPHLCNLVFPSPKPSERWTTQAKVVPVELRDDRHVLPRLSEFSSSALNMYNSDCREHDRSGEDRLAYVAFTRARDVLIASGHWWGPTQKGKRGPSPYLMALRAQTDLVSGDPWAGEPVESDESDPAGNPLLDVITEAPWPTPDLAPDNPTRRSAELVRALVDSGRAGRPWEVGVASGQSVPSGVSGTIAAWDDAIQAFFARSRPDDAGVQVSVPSVLSASSTMELAKDPEGYAERLVRPMPRPRSRHAELGIAFHAWVETRLGVQPLITDDELPGAADDEIASQAELSQLKEAFERLPYASQNPTALEAPFSVWLGGRVVRGRIDAVFRAAPDAPIGVEWEVVDWKTSSRDEADPLQLAIYRMAWAQREGVPLEAVSAAFAFVRSGSVLRPNLPDLSAIEAIFAGPGAPLD